MGKVKYATGIDYVSGALAKPTKKNGHSCGTYLLGTHRTAATTSKNCNRLYVANSDRYKRTTPVTNSERQARGRFGTVARTVNERMHDLSRITADQQAFLAQKDLANGKKTMKAYLWKLELQAYDEQHS